MPIEAIRGFQPFVPSITDYSADYSENVPKNPVKKGIPATYYKDTIDHSKEHYIYKEFFNLMTEQRKNHEASSHHSLKSLEKTLSANNKIRKDLFDQQTELIERHKKTQNLKIADTVFMAAVGVLGVIAIGLTILGFGVPLIVIGLGAIAGIASGVTKIVDATNTYQANLLAGQIYELGEKRKMNKIKSSNHIKEQNDSKKNELDTYKMLHENETKIHETMRVMGRS